MFLYKFLDLKIKRRLSSIRLSNESCSFQSMEPLYIPRWQIDRTQMNAQTIME